MEDFNSKYSGEQVEQLLDQVASGNAGGGVAVETDPIFSASAAASITAEKIAEWDGKITEQDLSEYAQVVTYSEDESIGTLGYQNKTLYPYTKASVVKTDDGQTAQDKFGTMVTTFADGLLKDGSGEQFFPRTIAERVSVGDQTLSEYLAGLGTGGTVDEQVNLGTITANQTITLEKNKTYHCIIKSSTGAGFSVNLQPGETTTLILDMQSISFITLPACKWANDFTFDFETGYTYEISFRKSYNSNNDLLGVCVIYS